MVFTPYVLNGFAGCSSGFFLNVFRIHLVSSQVCSLTSFVVVVGIFSAAQESYACKCWPSKCWPSTEGMSFWLEPCTFQLLTWKLAENKKGVVLL